VDLHRDVVRHVVQVVDQDGHQIDHSGGEVAVHTHHDNTEEVLDMDHHNNHVVAVVGSKVEEVDHLAYVVAVDKEGNDLDMVEVGVHHDTDHRHNHGIVLYPHHGGVVDYQIDHGIDAGLDLDRHDVMVDYEIVIYVGGVVVRVIRYAPDDDVLHRYCGIHEMVIDHDHYHY
jgi:hypothetical protein